MVVTRAWKYSRLLSWRPQFHFFRRARSVPGSLFGKLG